MINERKLSKPEANKREDIVMGMKKNKSSLVKKYGKEAERVMYGSATKKAKELAETKENKLKKMIEDALMKGISEKKAKKDYDGDGKIESSTEEYKGSRDKAIKKATLKEEPGLKKGDKVTYLGYPGEITGVNKEMTGDITYNVLYDKGTGKTKATNIYNKDGEIKPLNEDWGGSDEGALLNSMHKDLGNPKTSNIPSLDDVFSASKDANDFYRGDESDYDRFRESNINRSVHNYYQRYFPEFYEGMKGMFSENLNEDWIDDQPLSIQAKLYWMEKFKKGLIDKLPDNPKEAFLVQMTKDQMEHDEETLRRERGLEEDLDLGHQDDEPHMLKGDLYRIGKYAMELYQMVDKFEGKGEVDFPHWWQSKITKAKDMLVSAKHYLDFEIKEPEIDAMVGIASREDVLDRSPLDELKEKVFSKLKGK